MNVFDTFRQVPLLLSCDLHSAGSFKGPCFATLFELYCSLRQGKTLRQWIAENRMQLAGIDVRRFISFGVIKGFLYRVHRYPVLTTSTNGDKKLNERKRPILKYTFREGSHAHDIRHLDGRKHMDALCTMLECSVKDVEDQLASVDNLEWVWK
jgi:nitrogen permease regulator 2-like protein